MNEISKAIEIISSSKNIAIASHLNPDGDAIGSLLSLGLGLKQLGKKINMVSYDGVPKKYRGLPGADEIVRNINTVPDLAISVDCSTKELLGKTFEIFEKARHALEIDHHSVRTPYADLQIIDPRAAAVGELVYLLLIKLGVNINQEIAQNILTSIIVETDSFRLPSIEPYTFEVCAHLLKTGIDFHKISENVYWFKKKESALISAHVLSKCKFLSNDKIAWSILTNRDIAAVGAEYEDTEIIANEILAIKNVEMAILFREIAPDRLKVHLRSKGKVNVALFAKKYGGGGHDDSAACIIKDGTLARRQLLKNAIELVR
jgi:phosphoesterase RecJ-like protein